MGQQDIHTPFKLGYSVADEREAIQTLAGIRGFLMKGRVFTDRVDAEGLTVEDTILTELAIAADLVAPYEDNLKVKHIPGERMLYVRRNIRVLNFEEVLPAVRIKTGQAHDALAVRINSILRQGLVADIFHDIEEKYNVLAASKADSIKEIENLARSLAEASRDIHTGISQSLRFVEDRYLKLEALLERGQAFYQAMENQGGLVHVEEPPRKNWTSNVTHKISQLGAAIPFLKHGHDAQYGDHKTH